LACEIVRNTNKVNAVISSDVNKTKVTRPRPLLTRPRPPELNKGTSQI